MHDDDFIFWYVEFELDQNFHRDKLATIFEQKKRSRRKRKLRSEGSPKLLVLTDRVGV